MIRFTKFLNARRAALREGDRGFTLIELLVVVIIIGILAAIAVPIYIGVQNNAKDSAVKSDISNYKTAVIAFYTDQNKYPGTTDSLSAYGYTAPTAGTGNYGTTGLPLVSYNAAKTAFCIGATSVTAKTFAASDLTGVSAGTCSAAGVWTAPTTS